MQNKFELILIKENQFLNTLNSNSYGKINPGRDKNSKNIFIDNMNSYNPKTIQDDEDVRKNISEKIKFVSLIIKNIKFLSKNTS